MSAFAWMIRGLAASLVLFCALISSALADSLEVVIDRTTGQTLLQNFGVGAANFAGYTLKPAIPTASLLPANWLSISGNYDSAGNGSVDPDDSWVRLAALTTELSEGVISGIGGVLAEGRSINLGNVFLTSAPRNIVATYLQDVDTFSAPVSYRLNAGDYDRDGDVDLDDYSLWASTFGSKIDPRADGNLNGEIDAADYTVWRDRYTPPSAALASIAVAAVAVPEPSAGLTILLALVGAKLLRARR